MTADRAIRTVAFVIHDGCQSLDVSGPWEVFSKANHVLKTQNKPLAYSLVLTSPNGGAVSCNSGLLLGNSKALHELEAPVDTVIVAGGNDGWSKEAFPEPLLAWLCLAVGRSRRLCCVCTGAFVLAAAGLLANRRVTTHWQYCAELARRYPDIAVEPDAIYVADPPYFSSAGITAGIDLSLALVEADLGFEVALQVARELVLYLRRQGGQSQYSSHLQAQAAAGAGERFAALRSWMRGNRRQDLGLAALADRASMSVRNFGRAFQAETGLTPARFVELLRLEHAKVVLESTDEPLKRVAHSAGFGSVDALQRCLRRYTGITATEYRQRFSRLAVRRDD